MSQSTETTIESNPFTKPGFIIAAALVVALIAATVVIFLLPNGQGNAQPAPAPAASSSTATSSPSASAAADKSICGLPGSNETALGAAPKSKWELVGRMATPTDPKTFGPGLTESDGFRSCFAQSPTGALYSAVNMIALSSADSQLLNAKLTDKLLVPGPGRNIAMKDSAAAPTTATDTTVQIRGFLVKSYTPTEADVDLAFETRNGVLAHTVLPLRWVDGDWKAKVSDEGELINEITQLSDLSSFVAWSGV